MSPLPLRPAHAAIWLCSVLALLVGLAVARSTAWGRDALDSSLTRVDPAITELFAAELGVQRDARGPFIAAAITNRGPAERDYDVVTRADSASGETPALWTTRVRVAPGQTTWFDARLTALPVDWQVATVEIAGEPERLLIHRLSSSSTAPRGR